MPTDWAAESCVFSIHKVSKIWGVARFLVAYMTLEAGAELGIYMGVQLYTHYFCEINYTSMQYVCI
jgi:hypothetical protein